MESDGYKRLARTYYSRWRQRWKNNLLSELLTYPLRRRRSVNFTPSRRAKVASTRGTCICVSAGRRVAIPSKPLVKLADYLLQSASIFDVILANVVVIAGF